MALVTAQSERARLAGAASLAITLLLTLAVLATRRLDRALAVVVTAATAVAALALATAPRPFKPSAPTVIDLFPRLAPDLPFNVSENTVAYLLVPAICVALAHFLLARGAPRRTGWGAIATAATALVLVSGSRASLAGVGAGALAIVVARAPRRVVMIACAAGVVVAALLVADLQRDPDLIARPALWRYAAGLISDPLFGLGYGAFGERQASSSAFLYKSTPPYNAHDLYLQTVLDFGLVGAAAFAIAVVASLRRCVRILRAGASAEGAAVALSVLASTAAYVVTGVGESVVSTAFPVSGSVLTIVSPIWFFTLALPFSATRD